MTKEVLYLHFGHQCPGTAYMGEQARKLAELLGMSYRGVDIGRDPTLAEKHNVFFPGTIVIDDFQLVYPGRPEQMAESYRRREPLPGKTSYEPRPQASIERVETLSQCTAGNAFTCCIPSLSQVAMNSKLKWMSETGTHFRGLVGYASGCVVGFVEVLPETAVPYPIGEKSPDRAFITCLYSPIEFGLEFDYRQSLVAELLKVLPQHGYSGVSIVSGVNTPYPNGPETVLKPLGFVRTKLMGKALLRHSREEAWLLRKQL